MVIISSTFFGREFGVEGTERGLEVDSGEVDKLGREFVVMMESSA